MRTWKSNAEKLYLLLSVTICVALFQTTAFAQSEAAPKVISTLHRTAIEDPKSSTPATSNSRDNSDIEPLKAQLAAQQKQIERLERMLDEQKKMMEQVLHLYPTSPPSLAAAGDLRSSSVNPVETSTESSPVAQPEIIEPFRVSQEADEEKASPLAFRLGKVYISPNGFLDFTTTVRDKNVGSGIGTNFGGIPFGNSTSGRLSEFRFTAQNSRLGLRLDTKLRGADVLGYLETDFLGFSPANAAVTTNGNNLRFRLFWLDVRKGKWEVLAGQSWSLLTPNRHGLSPLPANIFSTLNVDPNLQVGMTWGRDPQFRVIYHASKTVTLGLSLEAAEQYGGGSAGAGQITLPSELANSYAEQLNTGDSTFSVPNLHPDVIAKIAFDPKVGGRSFHLEFAGLLRTFKFVNPLDGRTHSAVGGGASAGINYELFKNFRLIGNGFYSDGGGRWIFGLGPDLIIKPNGEPSLVHSASTVSGLEYQATSRDLFSAYYGGVYVQKNTATDVNGQFVGYGYSGSPSNHNRSIQELTFGHTHTFWRDANYGALQFMTQYSYLVRHPWSVAVGQPSGAHLSMVYLNLRYILPGAPPVSK